MSKPKIPNQRNRYAKLKGRLGKYSLLVQQVYDALNLDAANIAMRTGFVGGGVFRFADYPMTADAVNRLQQRFVREMRGVIYSGTSAEWRESNLVQDLLASSVLGSYGAQVRGLKTQVYYQRNSDALRVFQERTERGMNLSTKLWNQSGNYKQELEYAISSAIDKGTSAVTLSKRLSKYLHDFPSLKADYKEKFGQAVECQDCEYRSIRLARTEINMAYRTAEQERWRQMDFVVGYEVKLSFSHEITDICDSAQGKYPKDFVFMGWHPNCMCYTIPVLKTEEEFWSEDGSAQSVNEVNQMPQSLIDWCKENEARISDAREAGTLPYFFRDNEIAIATPINDAAYRLRTGRTGEQPIGNVEIFADRKYAKEQLDDGTIRYRRYGTRAEVRRQVAQWESIQQNIDDIWSDFNSACDSVVGGRSDIMFSGLTRKDIGSALRKADEKFGGDLSQCTDLVRCTFACRGTDYENVCNAIRQKLTLKFDMSTAEYMHKTQEDAYICRFMNPEFKNGVVGEIMVNPFEMVAGREKVESCIRYIGRDNYLAIRQKANAAGIELHKGHDIYEAARSAKTRDEVHRLFGELQEYYLKIQSIM